MKFSTEQNRKKDRCVQQDIKYMSTSYVYQDKEGEAKARPSLSNSYLFY